MLVVTRKTGERISIPDIGVEIVIAKVLDTGAVRVGISAPPHLAILRKELLSRGRTEGKAVQT